LPDTVPVLDMLAPALPKQLGDALQDWGPALAHCECVVLSALMQIGSQSEVLIKLALYQASSSLQFALIGTDLRNPQLALII
jgi:hypothetical protein